MGPDNITTQPLYSKLEILEIFSLNYNFFFPELNRGEDNAFNIEERIIWNPFLDGVKQFLNIISFGPTTQGNLY